MGNTGPNTRKESGTGKAPAIGLRWGVSCMQGWRNSMEDAHFAIPSLQGNGWDGTAAFGVMDGHGGADVAKFCVQELPGLISAYPISDPHIGFEAAFYKVDEALERTSSIDAESQGCTAIVCCVNKSKIFVANSGDSRAVLCRGGKALPLSQDHKPTLGSERDRIAAAGGVIVQCEGDIGGPRVMGDLNLSRSIGDLRHKQDKSRNAAQQIITCKPDVRTLHRQPNDEFMVLACDGVWDVLSSEECINFIRQRLSPSQTTSSLSEILEDMLDHCCSPDLNRTRGLGGDNMSAILVTFDNETVTWGLRHATSLLGCSGC